MKLKRKKQLIVAGVLLALIITTSYVKSWHCFNEEVDPEGKLATFLSFLVALLLDFVIFLFSFGAFLGFTSLREWINDDKQKL